MDLNFDNLSPQVRRQVLEARKSPLAFAEHFLKSPNPVTPDGGFKANYVQQHIMNSQARDTLVCVHRRAGKCLTGDAYVVSGPSGRPIRLDEAAKIKSTLVFDFEANAAVEAPCEWTASGSKPCVRLRFGTGQSLTLSTDHEVFDSRRGWMQAGELRVGDRILAPASLPCGPDEAGEDEVRILAARAIGHEHIPDRAFQLDRPSLSVFVKELFEGLGRLEHSGRCRLALPNRPFAFDLQHLLLRLGIEGRVDRENALHVEEPVDRNVFLSKVLGLDIPVLDARSPRRWALVVDAIPVGRREVYDLMVDHPDHNFVANNTVVHNSFSLAAMALWWAVCREERKILVFTSSTVQRDEFFQTIDEWIGKNELLKEFQSPSGNHRDPHQRRSFITDSYIAGYVLGVSDSNQGKLRGLTADIVFVDEGQELSDEDWKVVIPIMRGDVSRRDKIRTYVAGTLNEPAGLFYERVLLRGTDQLPKGTEVIFIPITENKDWTPEMVAEERKSVPLEMWMTEYLLEVSSPNRAVFRLADVDAAFDHDYELGVENIIEHRPRFLTVDWDKYQAGTNIAVTQYNTVTRELELIWHEEVPRSEFTYHNAVQRVLELWEQFSPELLVCDKGSGEPQIEQLTLAAIQQPHLDLLGKLEPVAFQSKMTQVDPVSGEHYDEPLKPFLVGRLSRKFQERKVRFPAYLDAAKKQFLDYRVKERTERTIKFTSKNEHVIDCLLFAMYAVHTRYENDLEAADRRIGAGQVLRLSYPSELYGHPAREDDGPGFLIADRAPIMGLPPLRSRI